MFKFASAFLLSGLVSQGAIYFEPNRGQAPAPLSFIGRTPEGTIAVRSDGAALLARGGAGLQVRFRNANDNAPGTGEGLVAGVSHYVKGADASRWVWDVPHFERVRFRGTYPGVDVVYHSREGRMEFDFEVAAGVGADRIRMHFSESVRLLRNGALATSAGMLHKPVAWQTREGRRFPVDAEFVIKIDGDVAFRLGSYDSGLALTIDPVVEFATNFGGANNEWNTRLLAAADGSIFLAGTTQSVDFPGSLPSDHLLNRPVSMLYPDLYVSKLKNNASELAWSLYLGGTGGETLTGLGRDSLGNIYLLARTSSVSLPITPGAFKSRISQNLDDLCVLKLDAETGRLKASTYLNMPQSGDFADEHTHLAVDATGGVYVSSRVLPSPLIGRGFVPTPGAFDTVPDDSVAPAILRLNSTLTAAVYITYFEVGSISAMRVDSGGKVLLAGQTKGSTFSPVNPFPAFNQSAPPSDMAAYVARLNPSGTALALASLVHAGSSGTIARDAAYDSAGNLHLVILNGNAFQRVEPIRTPEPPETEGTDTGPSQALVKIAADGRLLQSSVFRTTEFVPAFARIIIKPDDSVCLYGAFRPNFRQSPGALASELDDRRPVDGALSCMDQNSFTFRTLLPRVGGRYADAAVTREGALLLAGTGTTLQTTPGVVQPSFRGAFYSRDWYLEDIDFGDAFLIQVSPQTPKPVVHTTNPEVLVLSNAVSGSTTFEILGSGFTYAPRVELNGHEMPDAQMYSNNRILLREVPLEMLRAGANTLTVSAPPPGGGTSDVRTILGVNAPPGTLIVSPASVVEGAGELKVIIRGDNVGVDSVLSWNGNVLEGALVRDAQPSRAYHYEIFLSAADTAQAKVIEIVITNASPGGGTSQARFVVQPRSGQTPALFLNSSGGALALSSTFRVVTLGGTGFGPGLRAFWDDEEVPVEVVSATSIRVTPPERDLNRIAPHQVYVRDSNRSSNTVRFAGAGSARISAFDVNSDATRLYYINTYFSDTSSEMVAVDLTTGVELWRAITPRVTSISVSAGDKFLYLGALLPHQAVLRYNLNERNFDAEIPLPEGIGAEFTVRALPGNPGSLIVSGAFRHGLDTLFFVDLRQRGKFESDFDSPYDAPVLFVTSRRVYFGAEAGCWSWLDYNDSGFKARGAQCGFPPDDVVQDRGVEYFRDGARTLLTRVPRRVFDEPTFSPALAIDAARDRAFQTNRDGNIRQYNLSTQRLQLLGRPLNSSGPAPLVVARNGNVFWIGAGQILVFAPLFD